VTSRFFVLAAAASAAQPDARWLLLVGVLLVGSAFYSGSETALVSARRARLEHLASEGRRDARTALALLEDTARTIAVTLVGTNLCNIGATTLATAVALTFSPEHGPALATAVLTPVTLFGAEILPKAFFRSRPTLLFRLSAGAIRTSGWVLAPLVAVTSAATRALLFLLPIPPAERRPVFRREDLENLFLFGRVREASEHRREDVETALRMAAKALDLRRRKVTEAMVPIREEQLCPATATVGAAREHFRRAGTNHLAVVDEAGRVQGFVAAKSLLGRESGRPLADFARPAYVMDHDHSLDEVIQGLRRHQQRIAMIRGPRGETLGIVTAEDVLEEVVGELRRSPGPTAERPSPSR
jgi:CBS domain containing-hemolysin-like protein